MGVQLITPPSAEPLTLAEAKTALKVYYDDEDAFILDLITAARERAELVTRRALLTQTWKYVLDSWPFQGPYFWQATQDDFVLPFPPLQSVTSITYYDQNGASAVVPASSYIVDAVSEPARISLAYSQAWPTSILRPKNGIEVLLVAGYTSANLVPRQLKVAMKMLVAHWHENREAFLVAPRASAVEIPMGVADLLWANRVLSPV